MSAHVTVEAFELTNLSEVSHNAPTDKNIVLAALASVCVQLRNARQEVASFPSPAESRENFYIKAKDLSPETAI